MTTITQTKRAIEIDGMEGDELASQLFSFANIKAKSVPIYYWEKSGNDQVLKFRFHKYQKQAMRAVERFILLLGGTQSGKTSFGPIWLHREIKLRGAGDYLAVATTYPLMKKKMLPEFLRYFVDTHNLGSYNKSDKIFTFSPDGEDRLFGKQKEGDEPRPPTIVYFGHAQDPDSLESATAKAGWLDECGQGGFKLASFEAILRRLSLFMGRLLMTTTPYNLGWLKQKFYDVWKAGKGKLESIRVISFASIANPSFPKAEYERAKRDLPLWKFNMFYRAIFTRPAGMIYDCFNEDTHKVKAFDIPPTWRRYMGQDYGGVNTAAVFLAEEPENGRFYLYREYWVGGRTAKQHKGFMLDGEPDSMTVYGGARSEQQWRNEFTQAGLYVGQPPVWEVEVGINRVYGAIKRGELFIFDTCVGTLDQIMSYSRQLDDTGNPTEKIADKETFHFLDALRYIGVALWNDLDGDLVIF